MILQSDPEWATARVGRVTASRISDVIAKTKSGPSASRSNYLAELVAERLTGVPAASFTSPAMQWGLDTEPHARAAYQFLHDVKVSAAAFVPHPRIDMAGASPDGFVEGDAGLVEFKCPHTATHIDTLISGKAPSKYVPQMLWQMACTGAEWVDFVSFDPRMPERHRLFCKRVYGDDDRIAELEREVEAFLAEVDDTIKALERAA